MTCKIGILSFYVFPYLYHFELTKVIFTVIVLAQVVNDFLISNCKNRKSVVLILSPFDLKDTNTSTTSSFKIISFEMQRTFFFWLSSYLWFHNLLYVSFSSS